jgi:hypothetical protein
VFMTKPTDTWQKATCCITAPVRARRWALIMGALAIAACGEDLGGSDAGAGGGASTCSSFAYASWGACQSSGTQTRTVTSSLPSGCTGGSPVLSQSCTPGLDGAALYQAKCANNCHGPAATSNLKGKGITVATIQAAHGNPALGLNSTELQAIVTAIAH